VKIEETEIFFPTYTHSLDNVQQAFASKISPDGSLVAFSYVNGKVFVVNNLTRELVVASDLKSENSGYSEDTLLITSFSWMPGDNADHGGWVLYGAATDGTVREWTALLGNKGLKHDMNLTNSYQSMDISRSGYKTCLAGALPVIEIWDKSRIDSPEQVFNFEDNDCHGQRIHTVRFYPGS
jgi:WD40 repeat protein